jgi:hypothetical protein
LRKHAVQAVIFALEFDERGHLLDEIARVLAGKGRHGAFVRTPGILAMTCDAGLLIQELAALRVRGR